MRTILEMLKGEDLTTFLLSCRTDFKFFCERVLGLTEFGGIHPYQLEWFELVENNDRVMVEAPSGFAKTTILGVAYPLWKVFTGKGLKILLISRTITQSKDALLAQIRDYIEDNELLKDLIPKDKDKTWNQTQLKTSNNCLIINRPYAITIRGYRADIIICDEIDSYEIPSIFFDYVLSRLNPNGKIIGITTPEEGTATLINIIKIRDKDVGEYVFRKYTAIINMKDSKDFSTGESIWPERFSVKELMKRRNEMGDQLWQKNYMCNSLAESENSVFPAKSIESCKDYNLPFSNEIIGDEVYIGCDFAIASGPEADFDCYVVIEKIGDKAIIKYAERGKGIPVTEKVRKLCELYEEYNPISLVCDETSIGAAIIEQLRLKGLPVEGQPFHSSERNIILNNLKILMDNQKIIIPKNKEDMQAMEFANILEHELISFKEVKNLSSGGKTYRSKGNHDDTVMALAMAVKRVKIMRDFEDFIGVA